MNTLTRVPPTRIKVGKRHRRDLGDLGDLVASIKEVGLIQPVILDKKHNLIAGQRRIAAWKEAKPGEDIPAVLVDSISSAIPLLVAERDENTCRKDFAPSEAVALGEEIAALERPKAAARKGGRPSKTSGKLPEVSVGETREVVGAAVGMSGRTYEKAREVVATADDKKAPAPVRAIAAEAVQEMDATGKVDSAYKRVVAAKQEAAGVSPDDKRRLLRQNAFKLLHQTESGLFSLEAERVALVLEAEEWVMFESAARGARDWFDALLKAKPTGLRAIAGGGQ